MEEGRGVCPLLLSDFHLCLYATGMVLWLLCMRKLKQSKSSTYYSVNQRIGIDIKVYPVSNSSVLKDVSIFLLISVILVGVKASTRRVKEC